MKTRNKTGAANPKILIFLFIVALIGIGLYFGFHKASIINDISPENTYVSVISENSQQQVLQYTASGGRISINEAGTYNLNDAEPIAQRGGDVADPTVSNVNFGYLMKKTYTSMTASTTDVKIDGLPSGVSYLDLSATCTLSPYGDVVNRIQCIFHGTITATQRGIIEGITLTAKPVFYLNGYFPQQQTQTTQNNLSANQQNPINNPSFQPLTLWQRFVNFFNSIIGWFKP